VKNIIITIIALLISVAQVFAASFDCGKTQIMVEKLICGNQELSTLDDKLGREYREMLSKKSGKQKKDFIADQTNWLNISRNLCNDAKCLQRVYSVRLSELLDGGLSSADLKGNGNVAFCSSIQKTIYSKKTKFMPNSRSLTNKEYKLLKSSPNYLDDTSAYSSGEEAVDIDNDAMKEIFTFQIGGPDRRASMSVFSVPDFGKKPKRLRHLFSAEAGFLEDPFFVRYNDKNYMVINDITDEFGGLIEKVIEFEKSLNSYRQIIRCEAKSTINVKSACNAPVCKELVDKIRRNANNEFTNEIWPHKYMAPFGLRVFAYANPIAVDYDNSGTTRYIWKLGREGYLFENIYWSWMGEGSKVSEPYVKRPKSDTEEPRDVIPGYKHENLRKTIKQHETIFRRHKIIKVTDKLPRNGEFFFLKHGGATYWVWSVGDEAAWGKTMHIILTKGGQSQYVGSVSIDREGLLVPCENNCVNKL
jgi:uncharacterized protein